MRLSDKEVARLNANVAAGRAQSGARPAVAVTPKPAPKPRAPAAPARSKPPAASEPPEDEEPAESAGAPQDGWEAVLTVAVDPGTAFLRVHIAALSAGKAQELAAYFAGMLPAWPELVLTTTVTVNGTNLRAAGIPTAAAPEFVAAALALITNPVKVSENVC